MSHKFGTGAARVAAVITLTVVSVFGVTGVTTTTVAGNSSWCC